MNLITVLFVVTFVAKASTFEASGIFYVGAFGVLGDIYRFNVQNLQCSTHFYSTQPLLCNDFEIITGVKGNPVAGYTNEMVKGLGIYVQSVYYMPSGFAKYFPNILGLELANSNVKVIRKKDLSPFKFLQHIVMHGNRFESLGLDTFEGNPDLVNIFFANNDFKYLDPRTFAPLTKLQSLDLTSNRCINKRAANLQELAELKVEMNSKCTSVEKQISDANIQQDEKRKAEIAKLEAKIEALEKIVTQFVSNDSQEYCNTHLKILGKCMTAASQ